MTFSRLPLGASERMKKAGAARGRPDYYSGSSTENISVSATALESEKNRGRSDIALTISPGFFRSPT
jgi:hypothetical protein